VAALAKDGHRMIVVVSAQGDTTDELLLEASRANPRERDAYIAIGELLSAGKMAMALEEAGCPAVSLAGWQAGIRTDGVHGNARILEISGSRIEEELAKGNAVVVAGFQGIGENGDVTTLGRGGSDTTAVALAAFLQADRCRIFTDVDGVYDRDPRQYPGAVRFESIDYDRMLSLARSGAQVLHDRCVEWGKEHGVRIRVKSSFRPGPGTLVESFSPDPA
jgi:aspartate kinase